MLRFLPADSAQRIRLLAKFMEKDYEKIGRLLRIRQDYVSRVQAVEQGIKEEKAQMSSTEQTDREDEWLSRRLDAGLFSLQVRQGVDIYGLESIQMSNQSQTVDVILAWLVAEDEGAKAKIRDLLSDRDETLQDLKKTLHGMSYRCSAVLQSNILTSW